MPHIKTDEDYYQSLGWSEEQIRRQRILDQNKKNQTHLPVGGGYVGYHGSVDEQPDNPQCRYTDDDD